MLKWERKRILIWGKTRPEISKKYRETVCTGGVFKDTKHLIRIYPIPLRYMDDERIFKKYQWIEANVTKSASDPRPESYKIQYENIEIFETIPTDKGFWNERAKWIINDHNVFQSVEELQVRQQADHTSLGLVKPLLIDDIVSEQYNDTEKSSFWDNYKNALKQLELQLEQDTIHQVKPLSPPDFRFIVKFNPDYARRA